MSRSCPPSIVALAFVVIASALGCSASPSPRSFVGSGGGTWVSPLSREHPLVGTIHDVAGGHAISSVQLAAALEAAEIVLLGEQHDNVDHHLLQAFLLEEMTDAGRRPAIAFEQLDVDEQATVDAALAASGRERESVGERATALAEAVEWGKSGWPPFDEYRPVFEEALGAGLPILAANLSRAAMGHVLAHSKAKGTDQGVSAPVGDGGELTPSARASLASDIEESHCGYADDRMVAMMIDAQRLRDETMAGVVRDAPARRGTDGAVLICGFGHARTDYGVPHYLRHREPGRRIVSVGFLEVLPGLDSPDAYAQALHAARLPFDYVVFTPRADDEDPCEKFRAGLEKMKAR